MQYNCLACHDTGSISKHMTGHLDCISCSAATERVMLEAFIEDLPAMGERDKAWVIHQRALAMAPKQEAQEPVAEVSAMPGTSGFTMAVFKADDMPIGSKVYAATAAANGALTDGQIDALWNGLHGIDIHNKAASSGVDTAYALRIAFARAILAAAGPDAALVKALESALAIINNEADPKEYADPLKAIRAALSGAKGN